MATNSKSLENEFLMIENDKFYIVRVDVNNNVISKVPVKKAKKTSSYFNPGGFVTVHYERLCKLLKTKKDYGNLTFRLLFELLGRIDFNNRIKTFRQAELAEVLDSYQQHISTALKVLEKDGIIKKREHDYYFTPKFIRYVNDGFEHLKETAEDIDNMQEEATAEN